MTRNLTKQINKKKERSFYQFVEAILPINNCKTVKPKQCWHYIKTWKMNPQSGTYGQSNTLIKAFGATNFGIVWVTKNMKVNNIQRQPTDRSALQIFSTCNLNCPRANYVEMIRMNGRLNILWTFYLWKSVFVYTTLVNVTDSTQTLHVKQVNLR